MSYRKGSKVWVEEKGEGWVEAEVAEAKECAIVVLTSQRRKVTVLPEKLLPRDTDEDLGGGHVDDMTKLTYLNEPGVLYNLKKRYALNEIYTYTGSILIAVNPFTRLPHLYNEYMMEQYKGVRLGELSPHVFAVADASYRAMVNESRSQSILVSGESGAGKTETTKLIMQYLTFVGGRAALDDRTVEQQVLESNPLLEAFGNAKTVRNDNSSRFGKFVEIQFDASGRISGAAIRTYLLERSRVVQITDPERNFHCFYQLCASGKDAELYKLGHASSFHYLNQSKTYDLEGTNNEDEYWKTKRAMDIVGISRKDQDAIFRTLAAILHLGNIEFAPGKDSDSSKIKDSTSNFHLQTAANLFMCDPDLLVSTLCSRSIHTREGIIVKELDCAAAAANRDALAKTVYARLFDWYKLVSWISTALKASKTTALSSSALTLQMKNFSNTLMRHHVFKMEQEEYKSEEINWSYIEFIDNQDVLDLIEKKPIGIIALLDEACMFPKSTHETFATKMFRNFSSHPRLEKTKFSETDFTISHYAGKVTYQTDSFLEKNRDYIVAEHCNLLSSSRCPFVSGLFISLPEESIRSSYKFSSVASRFKGVLEAVRISLAGYPTRRTYAEFVDRFAVLVPELMIGSYDERTLTKGILEKMKLDNFQAANEAGALREAKNKLEKKMDDLALRLTLERRLRAASEETKSSEILKRDKIIESLSAECAAAKSAAQNEHDKNLLLRKQLDDSLREITMLRSKKIMTIEAEKENSNLKNLVESLSMKNSVLEKELTVARKSSDDTMEKLKDVEGKCNHLQQNLDKLQEKLTNLENENHVLRQKAFNMPSMNNLSVAPKKLSEESPPPTKYLAPLPQTLTGSRRSRMPVERHEENHEILLRCIQENLGFKDGKPVAACIIYKCLLHWRAFESERTAIFDHVIEAINDVLKGKEADGRLPYWLSNTSALLCLLQRNLRSNGLFATPSRRSGGALGLGGKIVQTLRSPSKLVGRSDSLPQVDARYPAILFKQQLTACVEKIFGQLRDNLKKEISPLLNVCIQAPKSTRGQPGKASKSPGIGAQPASNSNWDNIVNFLDLLMDTLRENHVPSFFIRKLITQLFSFINIQLFNSLLLRRECCTFSNGEYVKAGLSLLEKWITDVTEEFSSKVYILFSLRVIHQKRKKTLEEIRQDLCPSLSVRQIYRICSMYWDDKYNTQGISNEVVAAMREMVNKDTQNLVSNSFLLDDDLSIPFSTEDLSMAIPAIDYADVDLPESLQHYTSVQFLLRQQDPQPVQ
ncbi:Myosin-15 [Dichanthelium oligosanthes]|uniref:Myosin-15 n=1 Tax=Dichanthelium oligosanthes TaxID=888268 RepID=A0A1E5W4K0_9POAL|nr:Myosin-15 [Dichanthelium oligosanthes]